MILRHLLHLFPLLFSLVSCHPHSHSHPRLHHEQQSLPIFVSVTSSSPDRLHSSPISLLVTEDGGDSFYSHPVPHTERPEKSLIPERVWFLSSSVGWGVVGMPWYNASYLLTTNDGGRHWEQQGFPLVNHRYGIPHFIDGLNGWVVAIPLHPPYYFTSILRTLDGGLSWRITSILPEHGACDHITFVDIQHGWMQCWQEKSQNSSIVMTSDGGKTWKIQYEDHVYGHGQLSFSSDGFHGFSGCYSRHSHIHHKHSDDPHQRYYMMTSNGGMTWEQKSYHGYNMMVWMDHDMGWYIDFNNTLQRTIDGGSTWLSMYSFSPSLVPTSFLFLDSSIGYVMMKNSDFSIGYIYRTLNGGASYSLQYEKKDHHVHCLYAPIPTQQYGCRH